MKKIITLIVVSLFAVYAVKAVTWTVSNNPNIPGQFSEISEAIYSPSTTAGDTLLVAGSRVRYADFTLTKPYVIIGAGMDNPYGDSTCVNYIYLTSEGSLDPSGTRLMGLYIDGSVTFNAYAGTKIIEDVVIERCWLDYSVYFNGGTGSIFQYDTIRNCVMEDYNIYFDNADSIAYIEIHNNLFDGAIFTQYNSTVDLSYVTVANNVFIEETTDIFNGIHNMVIHDNIFFQASPQGCTDCNFTNNTSYGATNDVLPGANNIGTGNAIRDPKFVDYTEADGGFTFPAGYDFHLMEISLDDNSGTGDDERGMYGGLMPVELGANPAIPQMTEVSFPDNASSVEEGGTLNVRFKAKKND